MINQMINNDDKNKIINKEQGRFFSLLFDFDWIRTRMLTIDSIDYIRPLIIIVIFDHGQESKNDLNFLN